MQDLLFYTVLSFLFTHEMDAVLRKEWRLLPILRDMNDRAGAHWFVGLHVPLFLLFIWLAVHPNLQLRFGFQVAVDLFAMIHIWLHHLFRNHPEYDFKEPISIAFIWGAGLAGLLHLTGLYLL